MHCLSTSLTFLGGMAALGLLAGCGERVDAPTVRLRAPEEAAPLCPWREPASDLKALFPGSTGYRAETVILSAQRMELTRRLGRPPAPEEHSAHLFRVRGAGGMLGTVLVRRIKGENGAIELVVGVGTDRQVRGIRLQRLREPSLAAGALRSPRFLGAMRGLTADDEWPVERLVAVLPEPARASGRAVARGARSETVLLDVAERAVRQVQGLQ